jgi:hypothetical protein
MESLSLQCLPDEIQKVIYDDVLNLFKIDHRRKYKHCMSCIPCARAKLERRIYILYNNACTSGCIKTLRWLVRAGYEISPPASFITYESPLKKIIKSGKIECLEYVLNTPKCLNRCSFVSSINDAISCDNTDALDLLIRRGLYVTSRDIMYAIEHDKIYTTSYLINNGYLPDIRHCLRTGSFKAIIISMEMLVDPTVGLCLDGNLIGSRERLFDSIYVACLNKNFLASYVFSGGVDNLQNHFVIPKSEIDSCSRLRTLKKKIIELNEPRFKFISNRV